jgi:hypothetical protein
MNRREYSMARMIPAHYAEGTASPAEKRIFHLLANDPDLADWYVIHSLGLAHRCNEPYGEIDFVVLAPDGAVLCLEIKGGRLSCKGGTWTTMDRVGAITELKKSPFMQARDGMFALLRAVQAKFGKTSEPSHCLFGYAVVFPDVEAPPETPEFERWEVIDRDDLQVPISRALRKVISAQREKIGVRPPHVPTIAIREIARFLRPDFERVVSRCATIAESEAGLISLTEDQYAVLDMISDNLRCLIEGAAGTGKTVLALEYARRCAMAGKRVVLLCYNRLLADWLESRTHEIGIQTLRATSFFRFLRKLIHESSYEAEFEREIKNVADDRVFSQIMPFYGQLAAEEKPPAIDVLVADEAQDLLSEEAVNAIAPTLVGGLTGGQWYMFGDFTRQCIYGRSSHLNGLRALESACPHFARTRLQTNCRNTRRIGEETALLSGFAAPPYKLGQIDGLAVDYRYWSNTAQQLEKLTEVLRQLVADGVALRDLILISPRKLQDSVAAKLQIRKGNNYIVPYELRSSGDHSKVSGIGFATVHSFKGMESKVVVFCDVDRVENDEPQALLYIGMSRARSLLVMLVCDSERKAIAQSLARKLSEGWRA